MSERTTRRPSLARHVLSLAAVALVATVFVWSALFYSAARHVAAARATVQAAPADPSSQPVPAVAPVTTKTS